jgi:hypothetical protein
VVPSDDFKEVSANEGMDYSRCADSSNEAALLMWHMPLLGSCVGASGDDPVAYAVQPRRYLKWANPPYAERSKDVLGQLCHEKAIEQKSNCASPWYP